MDSLAVVRERAQRHQEELDRDTRFFSVGALAARWGVSKGTVRAIPRGELFYKNMGRGLKRELRRYAPDDVYAYELERPELRRTG